MVLLGKTSSTFRPSWQPVCDLPSAAGRAAARGLQWRVVQVLAAAIAALKVGLGRITAVTLARSAQ